MMAVHSGKKGLEISAQDTKLYNTRLKCAIGKIGTLINTKITLKNNILVL